MSGHSSPTSRRFVRAAGLLLAFQLVAAAGATGLAIWAVSRVQQVIDDRDAMALRLRELEARPPTPAEQDAAEEPKAPAEPTAKAVPDQPPGPIARPPVPAKSRDGTGSPGGIHPPPPPPPPPPPVRREAQLIAGNLRPPYPASEERRQRGGTVRVRVTIGPNGQVTAVEQLQATSNAFWLATERHARSSWRFRPATLDGSPIESTREMTVTFRIGDN